MALTSMALELSVVSVDDHLPSIESVFLQPKALRQRFISPPAWSPEISVEHSHIGRKALQASVLVPLVQRDELMVLLTRRSDCLNDHPGQIAFPGGRMEPFDLDATATALREAEEEIGLDRTHVDVLGQLPTYTTGSAFIVTPVVALVRTGFGVRADPSEVAEMFEVPLSFLMSPANHRRHELEVSGVRRGFFSMPWNGVDAEGRPRRYFIWGATAAMLRNLYRFLAA